MKKNLLFALLVVVMSSCSDRFAVVEELWFGFKNLAVALVVLVLLSTFFSFLSVLLLDKPCREQFWKALKYNKKK
jgi:lipoprotein